MLTFVEIALGTGGLPSCRRCTGAEQSHLRAASDVFDDVRAAAAARPLGPGPNLSFAGAEPFLHPELPAIVREAVSVGTERVRLVTGAAALAVGRNAEGSLDAGVRHLEVVLLAGEPRLHDSLLGRQGAFEGAVSGIERFLEAARSREVPVAVTGRVPICAHNRDAVPGVVGALAKVGAVSVVADATQYPSAAANVPWLSAVADTGLVNGVWVSFEGVRAVEGLDELHLRAPCSLERVGA